jgi:hypothetical protein
MVSCGMGMLLSFVGIHNMPHAPILVYCATVSHVLHQPGVLQQHKGCPTSRPAAAAAC